MGKDRNVKRDRWTKIGPDIVKDTPWKRTYANFKPTMIGERLHKTGDTDVISETKTNSKPPE